MNSEGSILLSSFSKEELIDLEFDLVMKYEHEEKVPLGEEGFREIEKTVFEIIPIQV